MELLATVLRVDCRGAVVDSEFIQEAILSQTQEAVQSRGGMGHASGWESGGICLWIYLQKGLIGCAGRFI